MGREWPLYGTICAGICGPEVVGGQGGQGEPGLARASILYQVIQPIVAVQRRAMSSIRARLLPLPGDAPAEKIANQKVAEKVAVGPQRGCARSRSGERIPCSARTF